MSSKLVKDGKYTVEEDGEKMMTDNNLPINELEKAQISDLADGLLRGGAFADAMALLNANSQARAYWYGLHVAGDVLRSEASVTSSANLANPVKDMAFLDTLRANLAKEPQLTPLIQPATVQNIPTIATRTANDSFFNWKWVSGLSATAAAVVLSWILLGTTSTTPNVSATQLAQSSVQTAPVASQTDAGVMLRNPQLDALIAAHNQVGGSSALQMPSGFLRSATFSMDIPATVVSGK